MNISESEAKKPRKGRGKKPRPKSTDESEDDQSETDHSQSSQSEARTTASKRPAKKAKVQENAQGRIHGGWRGRREKLEEKKHVREISEYFLLLVCPGSIFKLFFSWLSKKYWLHLEIFGNQKKVTTLINYFWGVYCFFFRF